MHSLLARFRWQPLALGVIAFAAGAAGLLTADSPSAKAASTIQAYIGQGANGIAVELFLPTSISVQQGDTVTWTNPYEEPHTLTFFADDTEYALDEVANVEAAAAFDGTESFTSGFIVKGDSISVTFGAQGVYQFLCLLHPGMVVDVSVLAPGAYIPPVAGDDANNTLITQNAIALGEAASAAVVVPGPSKNANGTSTYTVLGGPTIPYLGATIDVMRFYSPRTTVGIGDTVKFVVPNEVPHTVTFFPVSGPPGEINPFVPVIPTTAIDGSAYVNSGILSTSPEFGGVTTFTATFPKAGTYSYVCLLHADQGMAGVIVVGSGTGGAPISPPSTGDAGLQDGGSAAWMVYGGLALLVTSTAAAFVVVRR